MSIIRRKKTKNYSVLNNTALQNPKLSSGAKGVYAYLMTLPDEWTVRKTELVRHFSEGKASISSKFEELVKAGYITKEEVIEKGLRRFQYTVHETSTSSDYRMPLNGCRSSDAVNRTLINTDKENTDKETPHSPPEGEVCAEQTSPKPAPKKSSFVQDNPPTLQEVVDKVRATGKRNVNPYQFYKKYSDPDVNWVNGKGEKMKSWTLTLATWESNGFAKEAWKNDPTELATGEFAPQPPKPENYMTPEEIQICMENDDREAMGETGLSYPDSYHTWKQAVAAHKTQYQNK